MMSQTTKHAQSTVARARTAKANDELTTTLLPCVHYQLTDTVACSYERVAKLRLNLVQADSLCHFDDSFAILDAKVSVGPPHHRVVDVTVNNMIGIHRAQETLTAVAGLDLLYLHIVMLGSQSFSTRLVCLLAAHATLETVKYQ